MPGSPFSFPVTDSDARPWGAALAMLRRCWFPRICRGLRSPYALIGRRWLCDIAWCCSFPDSLKVHGEVWFQGSVTFLGPPSQCSGMAGLASRSG